MEISFQSWSLIVLSLVLCFCLGNVYKYCKTEHEKNHAVSLSVV